MKSKQAVFISSLIIVFVVLLVVNVVGITIGSSGKDLPSFVLTMVVSNVLIVLEEIMIILETRRKGEMINRVLGLPIYYSSFGVIGLQLSISITIFIINRFVAFPFTITLIAEILLIAVFVLQFVFGYLARFLFLKTDGNIKQKTMRFESFRMKLDLIRFEKLSIEEKKCCDSLAEKMRLMDPTENSLVADIDNQISAKLDEIENMIKSNERKEEAIILLLEEFDRLLEKRKVVVLNGR